jgi:CRP-like cAMP-binding protein
VRRAASLRSKKIQKWDNYAEMWTPPQGADPPRVKVPASSSIRWRFAVPGSLVPLHRNPTTDQERSVIKRKRVGEGISANFDLCRFSPFDGMSEELLDEVRARARLRQCTAGTQLFGEGDPNGELLYVVFGTIELRRGGRLFGAVGAGTAVGRLPLSKSTTHLHSAVVGSPLAGVLAIDADRLDTLVTLEQTASYNVTNLQSDWASQLDAEDWMVQALRSKAFAKIPPVSIQAMFMRMQRVDYRAGDIVIRQGDDGDYFYVIAKGRCMVTRDLPTGAGPLLLAELGVGSSFGEEALIAGAQRSANVSMATDGSLMRLGRADFLKLCSAPLINELSLDQAREQVRGGARWVDVRMPGETYEAGIPAAIRVPLHQLRARMDVIPRSAPLVVVCNTGRRSAVAAFILAQHGFKVSTLKGGMASLGLDTIEVAGTGVHWQRQRLRSAG